MSELTNAVKRVRETYGQPVNDIVARIRERHPIPTDGGVETPAVLPASSSNPQ